MLILKLCRSHTSIKIETGVPEASCTLHATERVFPEDWEIELDEVLEQLEGIRFRLETFAGKVGDAMKDAEQVVDSA